MNNETITLSFPALKLGILVGGLLVGLICYMLGRLHQVEEDHKALK